MLKMDANDNACGDMRRGKGVGVEVSPRAQELIVQCVGGVVDHLLRGEGVSGVGGRGMVEEGREKEGDSMDSVR